MNGDPMRTGRRAAVVLLGVFLELAASGCVLTGTEFRDVAGPAVQQGVTQVVNGLLDGLFAAIEPDNAGGTN